MYSRTFKKIPKMFCLHITPCQGPFFSQVFEADFTAREIENDAFHGHFTGISRANS